MPENVTLLRDVEWTGGLAKVTFYPMCAICTERLWSLPPDSSGSREVSYLARSQTTEVKLTQGVQDN